MAPTMAESERKIRIAHMKMFGQWLKNEGRTQKWAGYRLGIYPGYLSNLVTGKQMASKAVCRAAGKLMGPLDTTTGKPYGTSWTAEEARERVREEQRKVDKKLHQHLHKKTKKTKTVVKRKSEIRTATGRRKTPFQCRQENPKTKSTQARREHTPAGLQATSTIMMTWLQTLPPNSVTPDQLVAVTREIAQELAL